MNRALSWLLLAVGLGGVGAAGARLMQTPSAADPALVARALGVLDLNGDGVLDEAEYMAVSDRRAPMAVVDGDGSGQLEAFEIEALLLTVDPTVAWPNDLPQDTP